MKEMAALGQLIREARENRGMESQVLAQQIGVSKGTISNLERGVLKTTPDPSMLRSLSDVLGIPVSRMLSVLGYLDDEPSQESEAVATVRAILGDRELTESQISDLVYMIRGMVKMMERS